MFNVRFGVGLRVVYKFLFLFVFSGGGRGDGVDIMRV